jgi:phosphorylcholine metabolism protein LicD
MVYLKHLEKQEKSKPKSSRWREIIKIRAEINEIKTKEIYKESMKQKFGSLKRLTRSTNP